MNIIPEPEILKIQDKKYRVYKLDEKKYNKQIQEVSTKAMISYSAGGCKNLDDEPACNVNREQKQKEIERIKKQELEAIQQYKEEKQIQGDLKTQFTHFISIPLNKPLLIHQIEMIKEDTNSNFLNPNQAHITLLMLKLHDKKQIEKFQKEMKKIYPKITNIINSYDGKPKLDLKGLGFFGESKEKAKVLYINVKNQCRGQYILSDIVDLLCKSLIESKVIQESDLSHISYNKIAKIYELDKMHITLMKTKKQGETLNLTNILEKYQQFELKNFIFDQMDVSIMQEYQSNGYFKALETFKLIDE